MFRSDTFFSPSKVSIVDFGVVYLSFFFRLLCLRLPLLPSFIVAAPINDPCVFQSFVSAKLLTSETPGFRKSKVKNEK